MNRADKMLAYDRIDIDLLRDSQRNKEITKLLITGMTYKSIGETFGISSTRVDHITSKLARIANAYRKIENNTEHQALVELYREKLENNEIISISSDTDVWEHANALDEARKG